MFKSPQSGLHSKNFEGRDAALLCVEVAGLEIPSTLNKTLSSNSMESKYKWEVECFQSNWQE